MTSSSSLDKYAKQRAKYYSQLTKVQLEVHHELQDLVNDRITSFSVKQEQVTGEVNEYERHFSGYFALAISFIVSGLLTTQASSTDAYRVRIFFFATIAVSLTAALLLFAEYLITYHLFNRWQKNIRECIEYINSSKWSSPADLDKWLAEHQQKVPQKSTHIIQYVEIFLMVGAFILLLCWLHEKLFGTIMWVPNNTEIAG